MRKVLLPAIAVFCVGSALAGEPPSRFGVDAPELAHVGSEAVGVKTLHLVQHRQIDVLAYDAATGSAPLTDRVLTVDLWYPARPAPYGMGVGGCRLLRLFASEGVTEGPRHGLGAHRA